MQEATERRCRTSPPWLICLLMAISGVVATAARLSAQEGDRSEDHAALIALRETFTEAINQRDFEAMKPLVTDDLTFISISNEKVSGIDGLSEYWANLFEGENSILKRITVAPSADALTEFFGDSIGVAQGTSNDKFEFRKVGPRELTSRWTALVVKDQGQWKVARVHMSANVLDNPVLDASNTVGNLKLAAGAFVGFVLGALLMRRRRSSDKSDSA